MSPSSTKLRNITLGARFSKAVWDLIEDASVLSNSELASIFKLILDIVRDKDLKTKGIAVHGEPDTRADFTHDNKFKITWRLVHKKEWKIIDIKRNEAYDDIENEILSDDDLMDAKNEVYDENENEILDNGLGNEIAQNELLQSPELPPPDVYLPVRDLTANTTPGHLQLPWVITEENIDTTLGFIGLPALFAVDNAKNFHGIKIGDAINYDLERRQVVMTRRATDKLEIAFFNIDFIAFHGYIF